MIVPSSSTLSARYALGLVFAIRCGVLIGRARTSWVFTQAVSAKPKRPQPPPAVMTSHLGVYCKCMVPNTLQPLFWDTNLSTFRPAAFPDYTAFRVLEYGDD